MADDLAALTRYYDIDEEIPNEAAKAAQVTPEALRSAAAEYFEPKRRLRARSKRRAWGGRLRAMLVLVALIVAILGLQQNCHRSREAELREQIGQCRALLERASP
jgi:hypothetical protein